MTRDWWRSSTGVDSRNEPGTAAGMKCRLSELVHAGVGSHETIDAELDALSLQLTGVGVSYCSVVSRSRRTCKVYRRLRLLRRPRGGSRRRRSHQDRRSHQRMPGD